jgi:hypothetical protein
MKNLINKISHALDRLQVLSSIALGIMGFTLIGYSFFNLYQGIQSQEEFTGILLSNLSLIVIAIAILDVAKYVIEEAVESELDTPKDVRRALTKFVVIIFVAISLETIVNIFLASKVDFSNLVYPTLLLVANTLLLVGLGMYQKLSTEIEKKEH